MEKVKAKECFRIEYPNTPAGKKDWNGKYSDNAFYSGKHWGERKRNADYWHNMVRACIDRAGLRKRPFDRPVAITVYWNDRLDVDNHSIMGKMIVEAMKGRLLQNDNKNWGRSVTHTFHDGGDYIWGEVREI